MSRTIIDASVAIKWVVKEDGTSEALALLEAGSLSAPDLLIPECTNILWKKVRRSEFEKDEAIMAARLLQRSDVEILPTRVLMEEALKISVALDHAAYDCIYLSLAFERDWRFVTADERLSRKVNQLKDPRFNGKITLLSDSVN